MAEGVHNFDRRASDVNVNALATRIGALEETVHDTVTPELRNNTRLCTDLHDAIFGKDQDDGLAMKVQEMHDIFNTARNGIRVFTSAGNAAVSLVELGGKIAKPMIWIGIVIAGGVAYWKTGSLPDWIVRLLGMGA